MIDSASKEITTFNYKDLLINTYAPWFVQVYRTDSHYCQVFAPFWEEVVPEYPFLNFGRVNIQMQKGLIGKLPFGIKGFPFVYFQEYHKEPMFAELFIDRGNLTRQLKEFIFHFVRQEIQIQDFQKERVPGGRVTFVGLDIKKVPQIKLHYYVKMFREALGVEFIVSPNLKDQVLLYIDQNLTLKQHFLPDKQIIEKIFDLIANTVPIELNKQTYSFLCKQKKTKCLLVLNKQQATDFQQDQQDLLKEALKNGTESKYETIQLLRINPQNQPKLVRILEQQKGVGIDQALQGRGLLIDNEHSQIHEIELFDDIEFNSSLAKSFKNYFSQDIYDLLRREGFSPEAETINIWREEFISFWFILFSIIFLVVVVKKYEYRFWKVFGGLLILTISYSLK